MQQTLLEKYLDICQMNLSYVGGDGRVEDGLWAEIKRLTKDMTRAGIAYPDYETIECHKEDWV
jgi:hypothetical protein